MSGRPAPPLPALPTPPLAVPDDFQQTLAAARGGDQPALDRLFDTYYPTVERLAHREIQAGPRTGQPWLLPMLTTGDLVQESCRSVLRDMSRFEGETEGQFVAYLTAVVRNRLRDLVRFHEAVRRDRRRDEHRTNACEPADPTQEPLEQLTQEEESHLFYSVLADLPGRERSLILGRFEDRSGYAALARDLGFPSEDAARKAYYRAYARLTTRLARRGIRIGART